MPKTPLGEVWYTGRGFQLIEFRDRNDRCCELQQSSLADNLRPGSSAVWLGESADRMHLDLKQVRALIAVLETWVETGSFCEAEPREVEEEEADDADDD